MRIDLKGVSTPRVTFIVRHTLFAINDHPYGRSDFAIRSTVMALDQIDSIFSSRGRDAIVGGNDFM